MEVILPFALRFLLATDSQAVTHVLVIIERCFKEAAATRVSSRGTEKRGRHWDTHRIENARPLLEIDGCPVDEVSQMRENTIDLLCSNRWVSRLSRVPVSPLARQA